ncbi:MAG: phosphatidylserine/phosphatidylglycerophosphate/cardiolipin synthase family protein [Candidatus Sericytochromatia bacterium]|nr:phosphatidylserine/phosphatidylglycerophosphate/cardiolipin synthase family protein [Candidatus Sericytochromatia bacterium]
MVRRSLLALAAVLVAGCGGQPVATVAPMGRATMSQAEVVQAKAIQSILQPAMGQPVTWNNSLTVHPDREAYPVLIDLLRSARKTLWMETFEFADNDKARELTNLLIAKKKEGVDVRVIMDNIGAKSIGTATAKVLRNNGVPTIVYGPFPFLRKTGHGLNITHRKLYLVDGDKGMTGGMNLGDEYFDHAHDMLWKVQGQAAHQLHEEFTTDWALGKGGKLEVPAAPVGSYGNEPIGMCVTSPRQRGREEEIRGVLLRALDSAKSRIDMAYPFFSDDRVIDRLIKAAKRGVDVRVILTKESHSAIEKLAIWSARQAMPKGVKFHWWNASYAHIKYTAVDGAFLLVGSSNADTLTFENNQELDLILTNPRTVSDFRGKVCDPDWAATPAVTEAEINVPWTQKPWIALLELIDRYI